MNDRAVMAFLCVLSIWATTFSLAMTIYVCSLAETIPIIPFLFAIPWSGFTILGGYLTYRCWREWRRCR